MTNNYKTMHVRQLTETAKIFAAAFEARGMSESAELIRAISERLAEYAGLEKICDQH